MEGELEFGRKNALKQNAPIKIACAFRMVKGGSLFNQKYPFTLLGRISRQVPQGETAARFEAITRRIFYACETAVQRLG